MSVRIPPRPNKELHLQEVESVKGQIEALQKKMATLQQSIGSTDNIKGNYDGKIKDLKAQLDVLAKERTEVNNDRNKKMEQVKALSASIKKKSEEAKSAKDSVKNIADIENRINNLERQISAGGLTMQEEKRMVSDISSLKKQRKAFEAAPAGSATSTIEADKAQIEALKAELDALKPRKDEINAKYDAVKAELNELSGGKKKDLDAFGSLLGKKKALKAEIDELYKSLTALRDDFKTRSNDWFEATKAERVRREEEYKNEQKAKQNERLKKAAEQALENAEIPAFTEEINTCNALISFLTPYSTSGKVVANAAEATTSAFAASNLRKVETALPDGAVALKKKDDREEDFFMGGKKGKGKKTAAVAAVVPATKTLKIDLVTLDLFAQLKLEIPLAAGANVDASIAAIEEKKASFLADQAAQTLKNKAAAEARIAALQAAAEEGNEAAIEELEGELVVEDIDA
ncbi:hypothetical protein HDU79_005774 [Rhizoclosmatium sp. JEL0117]|nr:hypothetical protein HDU79_005774 [Rhizoclosmatium sp. JEL0117]